MTRTPFLTGVRLSVGLAVGAVAGLIAGFVAPWQAVPLLTWVAAALTWIASVWISILPMDNESTSRNATREDPHGPAADVLLLSASVASLGAVILGILKASHSHGSGKLLLLATGIAAIIASWGVVHTVFTLRYAALYYRAPEGGVNFNEDDKPSYVDFAYLAFTVGMTYQVLRHQPDHQGHAPHRPAPRAHVLLARHRHHRRHHQRRRRLGPREPQPAGPGL